MTSDQIKEHRQTTREVLAELGAAGKTVLTVFNKTDLLSDPIRRRRLERAYPDASFVSARTGAGIDALRDRLAHEVEKTLRDVVLFVPHNRYDVVARLHRTSDVRAEHHDNAGIRVTASVPRDILPDFEAFLETNSTNGIDDTSTPCYSKA